MGLDIANMCRRALELLPLLGRVGFGSVTMTKVETVRENEEKLSELVQKLKNSESVSKFLQQQNLSVVTLRETRTLFDGLIRDDASMNRHLARNAPVVHNPSFEAAIVKIQRPQESKLTTKEINSVAHLHISEQPADERERQFGDNQSEDQEEMSYAVSLIEEENEKCVIKLTCSL